MSSADIPAGRRSAPAPRGKAHWIIRAVLGPAVLDPSRGRGECAPRLIARPRGGALRGVTRAARAVGLGGARRPREQRATPWQPWVVHAGAPKKKLVIIVRVGVQFSPRSRGFRLVTAVLRDHPTQRRSSTSCGQTGVRRAQGSRLRSSMRPAFLLGALTDRPPNAPRRRARGARNGALTKKRDSRLGIFKIAVRHRNSRLAARAAGKLADAARRLQPSSRPCDRAEAVPAPTAA